MTGYISQGRRYESQEQFVSERLALMANRVGKARFKELVAQQDQMNQDQLSRAYKRTMWENAIAAGGETLAAAAAILGAGCAFAPAGGPSWQQMVYCVIIAGVVLVGFLASEMVVVHRWKVEALNPHMIATNATEADVLHAANRLYYRLIRKLPWPGVLLYPLTALGVVYVGGFGILAGTVVVAAAMFFGATANLLFYARLTLTDLSPWFRWLGLPLDPSGEAAIRKMREATGGFRVLKGLRFFGRRLNLRETSPYFLYVIGQATWSAIVSTCVIAAVVYLESSVAELIISATLAIGLALVALSHSLKFWARAWQAEDSAAPLRAPEHEPIAQDRAMLEATIAGLARRRSAAEAEEQLAAEAEEQLRESSG